MDIPAKCVATLSDAVTNAVDVDYLHMTDPQFSAFLHALAWYMGGSPEAVDAFAVGEADKEAGTLTVCWITGSAVGSLTVGIPPLGGLAPPPITGWFRSVRTIRRLDLHADVRARDRAIPHELEVRPGVTIHWRDREGSPVEISAIGLRDQSARDRAAGFITRLQEVIGNE